MATTTTNLGLKKPAYSEPADIAEINDNMDIIDTAINALQDGMAIVSNNNTHVAIASGQYVYVRNHNSLATGLYKATSNIAANATLSSSNLTADSAGGLNALNSSISSLSDQITTLNSKIQMRRRSMQASLYSDNTITNPNLSSYTIGVIYGIYSNQVYSMVFDVASIETKHQMYISDSAHLDFIGTLTTNVIAFSNIVGFTQAYIFLYGIF